MPDPFEKRVKQNGFFTRHITFAKFLEIFFFPSKALIEPWSANVLEKLSQIREQMSGGTFF